MGWGKRISSDENFVKGKNIWCLKACFEAVGFVQDGRTSRIDFWELFWILIFSRYNLNEFWCGVFHCGHFFTLELCRGVFHVPSPFQRFVGFPPGDHSNISYKTTSSDRLFCESKNHISSSWDSVIFLLKMPWTFTARQPTQSQTRWIVRSNSCFPGSQGNEH